MSAGGGGKLRLLVVDEGVMGHRTFVAQLRARLADRPDVEATFATVPPPGRVVARMLRRIGPLGDADLQGLRWRLRWSRQARKLISRHAGEADVALVVTQAAGLKIGGVSRRIPCVLAVDATVAQFTALEYHRPSDRFTGFQQRLIARRERRAIAAAAAVVAWSEWTAAGLRDDYPGIGTRIEAIHPGIDVEWWSAAADRRAPHPGPLRVLFVGNDTARKGLGALREAVGGLEGDFALDVVTGDEVEAGQGVTVHRGISAGTEELRTLYAQADVFALPTRADAVPWAVLEAMAAGLPVLATDVGAVAELLGPDGGELVAPEDPGSIAAALRRLADPARREELGRRTAARARAGYDLPSQTEKLLDLLGEVAAAPAGGGRRFRRRTLIAAGAGSVAGLALASPYLALIPGEEFEQLVASRLGIEPALASELLANARERYGSGEYELRAAAFALAVRDPAAAVLPEGFRQRAIDALVEPMLSPPAANLAYALTGSDPSSPACAGLVREP